MDDVEQIILATGEVQVESSKNQGDRVIVRGNLAFQILYRREGGGLQTLAGRIPFEESINVPELDEKDYVQIFWNLEDLTAGIINSRKLNILSLIHIWRAWSSRRLYRRRRRSPCGFRRAGRSIPWIWRTRPDILPC